MPVTNINRVIVSGNLTADPDLRETGTGHSVCELRLANNVAVKRDGNWESKPNFFQVNCWGKQGENCAKFLEKGSPVTVDGRLEWQMWESEKNGEKQTNSRVVIVAENVQFGYKPPKGQGSGSSKPKEGEESEATVGGDNEDIPF